MNADAIERARETVRVVVTYQDQHDGGPFDFGSDYEDGSLDRVIASLNAIREAIPEEYRANARCDFDSADGYEGCHYATVEVTYDRPETDDEVVARRTKERAAEAEIERSRRAEYERLKKRYG